MNPPRSLSLPQNPSARALLLAFAALVPPALAAPQGEVDFEALGQEFHEANCPEHPGDETCSVADVLAHRYAHIRLGAFEVHHPVAFFEESSRRDDFHEVLLGLLDFEETWLRWATGGTAPFPAASEDLAAVRDWIEGWKPKRLGDLAKRGKAGSEQPTDLAVLFEAPEDVVAAETRLFDLFHDRERLGLAILDQGIGEAGTQQAVAIVLAPSRRDFVGWLGFGGLVEPDRQAEYWAPGTHEWTQIWSGWNLILAMEYAPWTGFDPAFEDAKSMRSFEDTGLVEHVALQAGMGLMRYCLERPLDHFDNAIVLNCVIDFVGQVNVMDAEGQISRSGAQTQPYSRFVPGGNPNGGLLPPMNAGRFDSLVKNQWRESNGEDHFLEALQEGQEAGHKRAKKEDHPREKDELVHFLLRSGADKYVVSAPFFGPHASEQAYPPAEFLIDYREFYRAYKSAFVHWLRLHGVPDDEEASAARFSEFLRSLDDIDFEERGMDDLLEAIYGLPLSAADGESDSLEWRFLAFVEDWKG